jgi:hypothetical protein
MKSAAANVLLPLAAILVLSGCAGAGRPSASLADNACRIAPHGVTVTTRGTRLALRDAPPVARLQRASTAADPAGLAVLSCTPRDGVLTRCVVLYEEPGAGGFGKRALAWADRVIWPADAGSGTAEVRFRFDGSAQPARLCR